MISFNPAAWYRTVASADPLLQGDQLLGITLRVVMPRAESPDSYDIWEYTADVIVATQSCDLEQRKVTQVEVIPVYSLVEWLREQPLFYSQIDTIRRGHVPGAYLLPAWPDSPIEAARTTRIVAFDEKRSISWREIEETRGRRLGLRSPYIEHFGQAVARFYMRVGLPEDMPPVEWRPVDGANRYEQVVLSPHDFAARSLPTPTAPIAVRIQHLVMVAGPDIVYRAAPERDGSLFGIGGTPEEAILSLQQFLLTRRAALEGKRPHWLLDLFPPGT